MTHRRMTPATPRVHTATSTAATAILVALLTFAASPLSAQSLNIDFGSGGTLPSAGYGAAGPIGAWNEIGVLPAGQRAPLVGLNGAPVTASIYMIGGTTLLTADDPGTTGNDGALVDDMLFGYNNPVDVCVWVENLEPGDYEVLIYALTPANPSLHHRVRVDFAAPGPMTIGGAWPGAHQQGVSYERFTLTVTNGRIGLHSGLYNGFIESGINGIQIIQAGSSTSGVETPDGGRAAVTRIWPNPAAGLQRFELVVPGGPGARSDALLTLHDATGRLVWRRGLGGLAGTTVMSWDGLGSDGRPVPAGVYFLGISTPGDTGPGTRRMKLLRIP